MSYGANNFLKREFVLKLTGEGENDAYPNYVAFNLTKDNCPLLDGYQLGAEIKVRFNLGGRLWEGNGKGEKCFVDLEVWKLASTAQQQAPQHQQQQMAPQQAPRQQQAPQQQMAPQQQCAQQAPPQGQPMGASQAAPLDPNAGNTNDIPW